MKTIDALRVAGRVVRSVDFWVVYLVVVKCFLVLRWSSPSGSTGDLMAYLIIFNVCVWLGFRYRLESFRYCTEQQDRRKYR